MCFAVPALISIFPIFLLPSSYFTNFFITVCTHGTLEYWKQYSTYSTENIFYWLKWEKRLIAQKTHSTCGSCINFHYGFSFIDYWHLFTYICPPIVFYLWTYVICTLCWLSKFGKHTYMQLLYNIFYQCLCLLSVVFPAKIEWQHPPCDSKFCWPKSREAGHFFFVSQSKKLSSS